MEHVEARAHTIEQTAQILNVHWQTVRNMVKEGQLDVIRVGKRGVRITADSIQRCLKKVINKKREVVS